MNTSTPPAEHDRSLCRLILAVAAAVILIIAIHAAARAAFRASNPPTHPTACEN